MKKMTKKEVRLLVKTSSIQKFLIEGWNKKRKDLDALQELNCSIDNIYISWGLLLVTLLLAGSAYPISSGQVKFFAWTVSFCIFVLALLAFFRGRKSMFAQDINSLYQICCLNWLGNTWLHLDEEEFRKEVAEILHNQATHLERTEDSGNEEMEVQARLLFKKLHTVFLAFDLCDENQGIYFPRNKEKATANPKTIFAEALAKVEPPPASEASPMQPDEEWLAGKD